jgi:hypothetical protein
MFSICSQCWGRQELWLAPSRAPDAISVKTTGSALNGLSFNGHVLQGAGDNASLRHREHSHKLAASFSGQEI